MPLNMFDKNPPPKNRTFPLGWALWGRRGGEVFIKVEIKCNIDCSTGPYAAHAVAPATLALGMPF